MKFYLTGTVISLQAKKKLPGEIKWLSEGWAGHPDLQRGNHVSLVHY